MKSIHVMLRKVIKATNLICSKNGRRGLVNGVAMTTEHIPALRYLNPLTVIDIGANKGQFSLLCRELFPDAKIVAFEPLEGPAEKYRKLFQGDPMVKLHQTAIGRTRGPQEIHISKRIDSSSLLPISSEQSKVFPGTEAVGTETISVAPLTDFIDDLDTGKNTLLKIDVQGFELEVLKGCGVFLSNVDYCYIECSYRELYTGQAFANDIIVFLNSVGFNLSGVFGQHLDNKGKAVQADFLFERN